jgi:hypothetical protein
MKTISEQRINDCMGILNRGEEERQLVKERIERLSVALLRVLDEIEEFGRVVYCKGAAACWLDNNVLKILAGSMRSTREPLEKDIYYHAPSPAATFILGRNSNGWKDWKDRRGKSIEDMRRSE